jgi:hypothetical protein
MKSWADNGGVSLPASRSHRGNSRFFGFVNRRPRWGLSARGWLAAVVALLVAGVGVIHGIHPFLAISEVTDASILVIEGWVSSALHESIAAQVRRRGYEKIVIVRGLRPIGDDIESGRHSAALLAQTLRRATRVRSVQTLHFPLPARDRTFQAACETRRWLAEHSGDTTSVNVLTVGPHGRRSRLLFQRALGSSVSVGVISIPDSEYEAGRWWRSSPGVRSVIGEVVAYIYARAWFASYTCA